MMVFLAGVVVGALLVIGLAVVLLVWAAAEAEKAEKELGEL